ncbi:MAG: hypothetical protein WD335_03250 [Candidatus Paceibacterota bacterium]
MKKTLQIGNILSVIWAITANAIVSTSYGLPDIRLVSERSETLLNPATYAFSIWTLIYLGIFILALYQARDFFSPDKHNTLPWQLSGWFMLANILNGLWTYIFISGYIALSVIIISTLLFSLMVLLWRLRIAIYDAAITTISMVWWPLLLYTGWVLVATVVNTASLLAAWGFILSAPLAATVIIALGISLSIFLEKRNVRLLVLGSVWGIAAVAVAQYGVTPTVWITAAGVSFLLLIHVCIHAYRKRATNPLVRLIRK